LEMVLYVDRAMRGAWRDGETRGTRAGVSAWTRGIPRGVGGCAGGRRCRGSTPAGTVPHAERTQSPPRWRLNARDEVRVGEIWRPETRRAGYRERDIGRRRARMSLRGRAAHHLNLGHRRLAFWVAARIDLGRARFADFLSSFGSAKSSIGARCVELSQESSGADTCGHLRALRSGACQRVVCCARRSDSGSREPHPHLASSARPPRPRRVPSSPYGAS
jgi:hypothetical protein